MEGALWVTLALVGVTTLPPLVPNAALIATAGALAAEGRLPLPLVLLVVAGSALAGDALVYWLGRRTGARSRRWLSTGPRRRAALDRTAACVRRYGVPFVIAVRFVPSGRIVGGLATGTVGYPARRFLLGSGLAELLWASYSVGVGYWGGRALAGTLAGALLGVGASVVLAGAAAAVQRVVRRRASRRRAPRAGFHAPRTSVGAAPAVPPQGGDGQAGIAEGMPDVMTGAASVTAPVPRPAGDPLADGVREPVGPASFHQIGRG